MPYNPDTKTYTFTTNGEHLLGIDRGNFMRELKTLPKDVEDIDVYNVANLGRLPDFAQYTALKRLSLRGLGLEVFDCTLPDSLERLIIPVNQISEIVYPLPPALILLDISNNPIEVLPALPDTLTILACTKCPIGTLPSLPPALEVLYASMCGLTALPDLPGTLKTLSICANNIHRFPAFQPTITTLKIDW
jgi:Leucine-rich repeat (LRR) protein